MPNYIVYYTRAWCPTGILRGVPHAWKQFIYFHPVPQKIQDWRQQKLNSNTKTRSQRAVKFIPYVIHRDTGHVLTVTSHS